jgi:hypothetical protein
MRRVDHGGSWPLALWGLSQAPLFVMPIAKTSALAFMQCTRERTWLVSALAHVSKLGAVPTKFFVQEVCLDDGDVFDKARFKFEPALAAVVMPRALVLVARCASTFSHW